MKRSVFACVMGDMDLIRPIGIVGIPCAVVARQGAAPRYSRFARARVDWLDAWDEPEALVDVLVRFGEAQAERPVLFYEEDRELLLVSRYRDRLAGAFRFVVPDATLVEDLVDKDRFRALATRVGLPTPGARLLRADDDAEEALDLRFPVIVKPLTRRTDRWEPIAGSRKAIEVDSASALRALRRQLAAAQVDVLAQELIPGPESAIESYHVYADIHGEIVGEFTGRKIRTYPACYGHSTALETTDAADVATLGRALVARLGLRGVAKFDFKRSPDGELHLLEVNPRFNLWHHLGAVAGVNLPALVYGDLVGDPRSTTAVARPGVNWCKPWRDLSAARQHGVPLRRWLPWMMRCEAKRLVAWDDPLPLVLGGLFHLLPPSAVRESARLGKLPGARVGDVPYPESSRSPA